MKLYSMEKFFKFLRIYLVLVGLLCRVKIYLWLSFSMTFYLLSLYQVPKPINFFLESYLDEKGVKQILRLILSKFIRRQLGRSDNDWANLWHDLLSLQEKAFPFLDLEYVLIEFCRGLLKAGKFSLARNYLKGTGSVALAADKAESLVIQAAREYFFSASSLDSQEVCVKFIRTCFGKSLCGF